MNNKYGMSRNNTVRIQRGNMTELNQAIADLEERGFELVSRDDVTTTTYRKGFDYKENNVRKYKYSGDEAGFAKCRAVMRKVSL